MNQRSEEPKRKRPGFYVPDLEAIGYRRGFSATAFLLGLGGAAIGATLGYLIYVWVLRNFGLDGLCIPGAMLGLGFGLAARRPHPAHGIVCGILALGLGVVTEWLNAPFVADDSFGFFLKNLNHLSVVTWIMILLGCFLAYSIGQGRR